MTTLMKKTILAAPVAIIATLGFASTAFAATPNALVGTQLIHAKANILTTNTHLKPNTKVVNFVRKTTPSRAFVSKKRVIKSYKPVYKVKPTYYSKSYNYGYKPVYSSKFKTLNRNKVVKLKRAY